MSNQLEKQFALSDIKVQKNVTGEVCLHFNNPNLADVVISNSKPVDLLLLKGVTLAELRNSNLKTHVSKGCLTLV